MKIRIMPDFESTGLWNQEDRGVMFEFEDLYLPKELQVEFSNWIEFYDNNYDLDHSILNQSEKMNEMGLELAKKIKALYPDDYVEYVGEDSKKVLKPIEI